MIRLEPAQIKWLRKESKRLKISIAQIIRSLIEDELGYIVEND